jgi:hypothetical protein
MVLLRPIIIIIVLFVIVLWREFNCVKNPPRPKARQKIREIYAPKVE